MSRETKLRYSQILSDLAGFDEWLEKLKIPVRQDDRAHRAIRVLQKAEDAFQKQTNLAGISKSEYLFSLTEVLELRDVYLAFRNHPPALIRDRLARPLSGPILPEHENPRNSDGRNFMFELALGAVWVLRGADLGLLEPDLALNISPRTYLIACKRPRAEHNIRPCIKSAAAQLRSALSGRPANYFGVIAISLSPALNPGNSWFSGGYDELSALLRQKISSHEHSWKSLDFHERTLAIFFCATTPADRGDGLFRLSALLALPSVPRVQNTKN